MFGSDEGRICLGCWGLCFGSDEGDTVDSVLVVFVFYCQGMSCFLGMILLCFLIISFKTEHSTWYLSKGSMSFNIFHFWFSHSRLFWWRFFLVVFWFERLSLRLIVCGLLHGLSGFRRGRPDEMCALFRLHGSITLIAFSRSRQAHKCSQDKMSSTCGMCCTMNKIEQVNASRNRKVLELEISAMGMSRCLIARCSGFRLLMWRNHRCFSNNAPEKEQQIGKWLVGGGGSLAIVTFGWDMWRHRQEQERVKNIIVNASFKAREPRVKIERKIMKASKHHLFFLLCLSLRFLTEGICSWDRCYFMSYWHFEFDALCSLCTVAGRNAPVVGLGRSPPNPHLGEPWSWQEHHPLGSALMTRLPKCWWWSVLQRQPWLLMQTVVSADSSFHHWRVKSSRRRRP